MLHLNLISAVDESAQNWCEQHLLRELMSEDLLFAKISEPEMTVINLTITSVILWEKWTSRCSQNSVTSGRMNGEIMRNLRRKATYNKVREETKCWGDYKKLPEEIPDIPLIRMMLLGAVFAVQTSRTVAFETNERGMAKISEMMDPCFIGRNVAVLQGKQFVCMDEKTRRRMNNAATPKVKVMHGGEEDQSAGRLVVPNYTDGSRNDEQGPSCSRKDQKRDDEQGGNRRWEERMQQDQDQAEGEDDKVSTGGMSSLDFNFLSVFEDCTETAGGTNETAEEGTSTLQPASAFIKLDQNLPESSSPGNSINVEKKILMESPRRRRIEGTVRVLFLGTLPQEEWEVYHIDRKIRTGCNMDRVAFIDEVWTVVQGYGTQSMLRTGLTIPMMREILDKLDEREGSLSELLIDSAFDESEAGSPIKTTPQEDKDKVVCLPRTRKETMRSKIVIDKTNDMKVKLGCKVTLTKTGEAKVDSEISIKDEGAIEIYLETMMQDKKHTARSYPRLGTRMR